MFASQATNIQTNERLICSKQQSNYNVYAKFLHHQFLREIKIYQKLVNIKVSFHNNNI